MAGIRNNSWVRQLQFFTTSQLAVMRDRTASRNYSPAAEEFRHEHKRHRDYGLVRRHAERLRRNRSGASSRSTPAGDHREDRQSCSVASRQPGPAIPEKARPAPEAPSAVHSGLVEEPQTGLTSTAGVWPGGEGQLGPVSAEPAVAAPERADAVCEKHVARRNGVREEHGDGRDGVGEKRGGGRDDEGVASVASWRETVGLERPAGRGEGRERTKRCLRRVSPGWSGPCPKWRRSTAGCLCRHAILRRPDHFGLPRASGPHPSPVLLRKGLPFIGRPRTHDPPPLPRQEFHSSGEGVDGPGPGHQPAARGRPRIRPANPACRSSRCGYPPTV
jgi:hypothetical protein